MRSATARAISRRWPIASGQDFEIVAIDWPGQGRSPSSVAPSAGNYAALALAALDALDIEHAVLIGNSIGGAAALRVAAHHQDRVIALVLCNSGGLAEINSFLRFVIRRFVAFFRAGEEGKGCFGPAFNLYYRSVLPARPARAQRERIMKSGYEIAGILRQAWETFAQPEADLGNLVARVDCPVWIAWARSDRIIAWSRCRRAVRGFRNHTVTFFRAATPRSSKTPIASPRLSGNSCTALSMMRAPPGARRKSQ